MMLAGAKGLQEGKDASLGHNSSIAVGHPHLTTSTSGETAIHLDAAPVGEMMAFQHVERTQQLEPARLSTVGAAGSLQEQIARYNILTASWAAVSGCATLFVEDGPRFALFQHHHGELQTKRDTINLRTCLCGLLTQSDTNIRLHVGIPKTQAV